MPTVISDASVVIDLGAAGQIELLREFYGEVLVPPAGWAEVTIDCGRNVSGNCRH
jgi:predicted nucleic acid-binding protein